MDAEIKILPEPRALGTIIRKLRESSQAFKLKDLAYFLLDNPESVLLKVMPRVKEGSTEPLKTFSQCKACTYASMNRDEVVAHALTHHLTDYYDVKEVEVEPPKGNFNCVAKCGLSGVLLGPPNIHEFNSVVREMIRTKFPNMSEADYRARIEMVRDPESIEEWRKGATKKTLYFPKGAEEGAAGLTREQAESDFKRNILDNLVVTPKTLMITAAAALKSESRPFLFAVRDALAAERRAPVSMLFALRGAFHHHKMQFFRTNDPRGQEFVVARELKEFDAAHAIPELANMAKFIEENPCRTKAEICKGDAEAEKHLAWLVSTGHVVSFTNGVFSAVEKHPKYGPQWLKPKKASAVPAPEPEAPVAEPAPEPEAPVAEPAPAPEAPVAEPEAPSPACSQLLTANY